MEKSSYHPPKERRLLVVPRDHSFAVPQGPRIGKENKLRFKPQPQITLNYHFPQQLSKKILTTKVHVKYTEMHLKIELTTKSTQSFLWSAMKHMTV